MLRNIANRFKGMGKLPEVADRPSFVCFSDAKFSALPERRARLCSLAE